MARRKSSPRGRKPSIGTATTSVRIVRRSLKALVTELARIEGRLDKLDNYYSLLVSPVSNGRVSNVPSVRGRGPNIRDFTVQTLERGKKPMPLGEIAAGVLKAKRAKGGAYFVQNLGIALGRDRRFERTGRGIYALRRG